MSTPPPSETPRTDECLDGKEHGNAIEFLARDFEREIVSMERELAEARKGVERLSQMHHDAFQSIESGISYWMDGGAGIQVALSCFREALKHLGSTWSAKSALESIREQFTPPC